MQANATRVHACTPARDDQVQRHSICVWLKVASVINNWLCSCRDSRKLMSRGACKHLITRKIVLSTISLANVKEKFCFVYFYCTSAERKFVTKNRRSQRFMTLRLNARKNFNDFDSRWMCVLTHFRPTSEKTSGLFASLFWWSNTFVVRVHHRQAFDFRFFLEILQEERERSRRTRLPQNQPARAHCRPISNGKCRKEWIETRISWLELMGLSAGKKRSLWSPAVADLNCSVVYAVAWDRCLWATSEVAVKPI